MRRPRRSLPPVEEATEAFFAESDGRLIGPFESADSARELIGDIPVSVRPVPSLLWFVEDKHTLRGPFLDEERVRQLDDLSHSSLLMGLPLSRAIKVVRRSLDGSTVSEQKQKATHTSALRSKRQATKGAKR